jgi:hypothetical protein
VPEAPWLLIWTIRALLVKVTPMEAALRLLVKLI